MTEVKVVGTFELAFEAPRASQIGSPVFDAGGTLYIASQATGEVLSASADSHVFRPWGNSFGCPSGIVLDSLGNLYASDYAHAAIVNVAPGGKQQQIRKIVKEYENKALKGPSSLAFDKRGTLFFTDCGPLGESTLQQPSGSVYAITQSGESGQMLKPLLESCLAHPCGVAVCPVTDSLYVAELHQNRLLRFTQRPSGVYHCSVYHSFSAGVGPSAVAVDDRGIIFVARFDFTSASVSQTGLVSILHPTRGHICDLEVPSGPEVTGITLSPCQTQLYVTEASSSTVCNCIVPELDV